MYVFQDGSGSISSDELLSVMRAMGKNPTEDELLNLLMEADVDGNGTIDFPEFAEMMRRQVAEEADSVADLRLVKYFCDPFQIHLLVTSSISLTVTRKGLSGARM